jgi:hypothetical protein
METADPGSAAYYVKMDLTSTVQSRETTIPVLLLQYA